ncbi:MAG: RHS repeat protein [Lysobacteraceae bacterium]|nr:MAG: RHS repeat protein [Xanthomonadaceae bacterium]
MQAQESVRSWAYLTGTHTTQAQAEAAVLSANPSYKALKDIEIKETQTTYYYWKGQALPETGAWGYSNLGNATVYASEGDALNQLQAFYQAQAQSLGCTGVSVAANSGWTRTGGWTKGPTSDEARGYTATYQGCSASVSNTQMFRQRSLSCPNSLNWNQAETVCGGGSSVAVTSTPVVCKASCGLVHNPVDITTGEKYQPEPADLDLGWVRFARSYHSGSSTGNGGLGRGWTHEHAMRLTLAANGAVGLVKDDGAEIPFRQFTGGQYEAIDGSGDRISNIGGWTLYQADRVVSFDAKGRMTQQRFDDGASLSYAYDGIGRLLTITHSSGRALELQYLPQEGSLEPRIAALVGGGVILARYAYAANGQLTGITYADQTTRQYHYEDSRFPWHLTGISIADARYSTYAYDAKGRTIGSQHAGGAEAATFAYPTTGGAVVTEASGLQTTYGITAGGGGTYYRKLSSTSHSAGAISRTYYPLAGDFRRRLNIETDRNGTQTKHEYSEGLDAESGQNASIHTIREAYGLPQQRDREIVRAQVSNRLLAQRLGNREIRIVRNARLQPIEVRIKDLATNAQRTTATSYCEQADVNAGACPQVGLIKTVDGPRTDQSDLIGYAYRLADDAACASAPATCAYRRSDLWKITNALGQTIEVLRYDGAGRPLSVKDIDGTITDLEYNARGALTARKLRGADDSAESDDRITRIEYWPNGLLKRMIEPEGNALDFSYDAALRLTGIADSAGDTIAYTLNAAGERTREDTRDVSGALRRTLSRSYNSLGQMQTLTDAYGRNTGFTYDADGNLDQTTDALSRVAKDDYDPLGRLSRALQDANGVAAETRFQYDALDRLSQVTDPKGLNTNYAYNGLGDAIQQTSPDTGVTAYGYDSAGNLTSRTDARNAVATYSYDALNRPIAIVYPGEPALNTGFLYDIAQSDCQTGETFVAGRLSRVTDGSGSTTYCYNRYGDLVRKVQRTNGKTFVLRWSYQANGRLSAMTYPDGTAVDYQYDAQGRVEEIGATLQGSRQQLLRNASYAPFGPVQQWTYGNGRILNRSLNRNYQPGVVQDAATGGISLGYEFDEVGNLKRLRNGDQNEPPLRIYGYDGLNRLIDVKDAGNVVQHSYAYDKTGNRTASGEWIISGGSPGGGGGTPQWSSSSYSYPADSHRLSAVNGIPRSYDAAGNLSVLGDPNGPGGPQKAFAYNAANRMKEVARLSPIATYTYNAQGERVRKTAYAIDTYSVHDEAGRWVGDYDGSGQPIQQAIWFGDLPVGLIANASGAARLHYLEPDALGTPRVAIDAQRDVAVWRWDLTGEAFGKSAPDENPDGDAATFRLDMRFPGQRYDSATGLNDNYFRDYDASTGRYVQSDPIGLAGGVSTYGYARANPGLWLDRLGLAVTTVDTFCTRYPSACMGADAQITKPTNYAPAALGTGFLAASWCWAVGCVVPGAEYSPVPDYELSKLERSAKSKYCNDMPDPCQSLKQATKTAILMASNKIEDMLVDNDELFGTPGWITHTNNLNGRLGRIAAMISLGIKSGCDMKEEIALAAALYVPSAPR